MTGKPYSVRVGRAVFLKSGIWMVPCIGLRSVKTFSTRKKAMDHALSLHPIFPEFARVSGPGIEEEVSYCDQHLHACDEYGNRIYVEDF